MVQRSVCLCDGKYIGIESIFTVIDGKQINIPDKLSALSMRLRCKPYSRCWRQKPARTAFPSEGQRQTARVHC